MSLYSLHITERDVEAVGGDRSRLVRGISFAGTLQTALRLAGDATLVTPANVRDVVRCHPKHPAVDRALYGLKPPAPIVVPAMTHLVRHGRPLEPTLSVPLDPAALAEAFRANRSLHDALGKRTDVPPQLGPTPHPPPLLLAMPADLPEEALSLLPISCAGSRCLLESRYRALIADVPMPPAFASSKKPRSKSSKKKESSGSHDEEEEVEKDVVSEEDDFTAPNMSDPKKESDGEDLEDTADVDDAESVGEYVKDDFVVSDEEKKEKTRLKKRRYIESDEDM